MTFSSPSAFRLPLPARPREGRHPPRFHVTLVPVVPLVAPAGPCGRERSVNLFNFRGRGGALRPAALYLSAMRRALYNRDILRLAASIPHQRRLERPQASVEKRSPVCGSRIAVDVVVDGEGRLAALGQEVKACALGQASSSIMARQVVGSTAQELRAVRDAMRRMLKDGEAPPEGRWGDLAVLEPVRDFKARHASTLLSFDAVVDALEQAEIAKEPADKRQTVSG